jgi:hypothetical protein
MEGPLLMSLPRLSPFYHRLAAGMVVACSLNHQSTNMDKCTLEAKACMILWYGTIENSARINDETANWLTIEPVA